MKRRRRVIMMLHPSEKTGVECLFLGVLFFIGSALGLFSGGLLNVSQRTELAQYLRDLLGSSSEIKTVSLFGVFFSYYRIPLLVFFLGMFACGVWLIPLLTLAHGFFLAYSIQCLAAALGRTGVLTALAAIGIRCLFVLPCVFFLASRSWRSSFGLHRGGNLRKKVRAQPRAFFSLLVCCIVLLIGVSIEVSFAPRLLSLILKTVS